MSALDDAAPERAAMQTLSRLTHYRVHMAPQSYRAMLKALRKFHPDTPPPRAFWATYAAASGAPAWRSDRVRAPRGGEGDGSLAFINLVEKISAPLPPQKRTRFLRGLKVRMQRLTSCKGQGYRAGLEAWLAFADHVAAYAKPMRRNA